MKKHTPCGADLGWLVVPVVLNLVRFAAAQPVVAGIDPGRIGVQGGLVVQLGAADTATPAALSRTGRYLVNVLDVDAAAVAAARTQLRAQGYYGLVSADLIAKPSLLPYTENLVNLVIVGNLSVPASEVFRVLVPGGAVVVADPQTLAKQQLRAAGFAAVRDLDLAPGALSVTARKPWPANMDWWSHPRHGADGNPASDDTLVGPPDRVRWIAASTSEVEGMVSAGGRNYYGGVLARDSFNGLRLWHSNLGNAEVNAATFALPRLSAGVARPVAARDRLYAIAGGKLVALEAATGKVVREFPGVERPRQLANSGDTLVAADGKAVHAYSTRTGGELWSFAAVDATNLVVSGEFVSFLQGQPKRGLALEAVALDLRTGAVAWRRSDYPWLPKVSRTVLHNDQLAFEVSSLSDHDAGNGLHVVSARTGEPLWEKVFPPGMNHNRQARAMFLNSGLWILHGGKTNTADPANIGHLPLEVSALDPLTGQTLATRDAGLTHCFPPVATARYLLSGVFDMTDLQSGKVVVNPITKANCSAEGGWMPANGLVYTTPKHCSCWPMLRGFTALAPRSPETSPAHKPLDQIEFPLEKGPAFGAIPSAESQVADPNDWPLYRHDAWRSGSTAAPGPKSLNARWAVQLAPKAEVAMVEEAPLGPLLHDWRENPVVKGPLSAPTVANGLVFVTRPDAQEVLAVDAASGQVRWRFTADGRVDTPPAVYRGACLFGSQSGSVYALRADTGELAWRMQAGPTVERIVVYGQVESPWPVPGAVLVIDGVAYFAAGRQPFADGGVLVFSVDPFTGQRHWVRRLDTIPQQGYYENSGLEFDPFDILHQEGEGLTLSRWIFSRDGKQVSVDKWDGFARIDTGHGAVYVPRGWWTYSPRHQHRFPGEASRRPLCVFRDGTVLTSLDGTTEVFRRDFKLEQGETFSNKWITGWEAATVARDGGTPYRTYRLAEKAAWKADPFTPPAEKTTPKPKNAQLYNDLQALALSGDGRLFVVHKDGRLKALATEDGRVLAEIQVPQPAWDGLAVADKRLFLTTQTGELVCLGE
ncbi:MAG: hypothetical protein COZ06_08745 [Armatimonadetes bacterium CG_4_10_14_3_um_filter_66_18]|nr:PQQ-binding-like beta-propeller repeat protein [Armatimonadota bacterium]OIP12455.1 MAG: hypothetical protein AUJ96_00495 [Armatimonadetes bacterium CG2_30_66_41]PIY50556.1 MAG: hypothetical protein COZ06_08745 [Armatimonadetes bacterium CG_4_10_14_3_um_filter_66_18]PJB72532.1 MAG: hypothetical protein CO096_07620 [Armatimonadetes bacterium CG_4_9_14_3_um_filter_66_14]NCO90646.1 PQQ-binding-like beta-propeller repeat protein [Armatimonadota bacterium]